jgi:hypothetical protein
MLWNKHQIFEPYISASDIPVETSAQDGMARLHTCEDENSMAQCRMQGDKHDGIESLKCGEQRMWSIVDTINYKLLRALYVAK